MSGSETEAQHSSLNLNDILFILFRHRWKILLCGTAGALAAAAIYILLPSPYESQAKLLVRYVLDRIAVEAADSEVKTPGSKGEELINSEVEILTSWDLASQVVDAVGVDRLLGGSGGKTTKTDAVRNLLKALKVTVLKDTNIISVSYENKDPRLALQVLEELVSRYFDKHLEVHRSIGAFEFVSRETDRLRVQLNQTDEELKQLKAKAGIISLSDSRATLTADLAKGRQDLDVAEAELAAQQALVKELEKGLAGADTKHPDNAIRPPSNEAVREYQTLIYRLTYLHQTQTELLSKFTPENALVKGKQAQIDDLERQRRDLEQKFPGLVATVSAAAPYQNPRPDLTSEKARLGGAEARVATLRSRLGDIQTRVKLLSELEPQITELERRREVDEKNYKYFDATLEKARVDETLDPSRMPNISVVQKPSPAVKVTRNVQKIVLGIGVGGWLIGIAIALLIELVLDRTVRRRQELEMQLRIPLLLSIPYFSRNGHSRLRLADRGQDSATALQESRRSNTAPWESDHFIRPFCEAIRDRLMLYFERNRMTPKPKLVAVTGCSDGAGASTIATGLAATLSETCDGKVLLVDKEFDPKGFFELLGEFKTSDFEYVIFDMPSLSETSTTLAMAGFMDKVLLVVEAQVSNREVVKRAYAELAAAKANVSAVFNKTRAYGPKWLESEL